MDGIGTDTLEFALSLLVIDIFLRAIRIFTYAINVISMLYVINVISMLNVLCSWLPVPSRTIGPVILEKFRDKITEQGSRMEAISSWVGLCHGWGMGVRTKGCLLSDTPGTVFISPCRRRPAPPLHDECRNSKVNTLLFSTFTKGLTIFTGDVNFGALEFALSLLVINLFIRTICIFTCSINIISILHVIDVFSMLHVLCRRLSVPSCTIGLVILEMFRDKFTEQGSRMEAISSWVDPCHGWGNGVHTKGCLLTDTPGMVVNSPCQCRPAPPLYDEWRNSKVNTPLFSTFPKGLTIFTGDVNCDSLEFALSLLVINLFIRTICIFTYAINIISVLHVVTVISMLQVLCSRLLVPSCTIGPVILEMSRDKITEQGSRMEAISSWVDLCRGWGMGVQTKGCLLTDTPGMVVNPPCQCRPAPPAP